MKRVFLPILFLFINIGFIFPKSVNVEDIKPIKKNTDRPTVALVLAGGGAKGFAHLPIIELIEEMNIPIDAVIGTSIGSIIGGFYAAGYSPKEILESFSDVEWAPIFSDLTYSPYEKTLEDHSVFANPISINFDINMDLKLGKGISNGQKVYELLKSLSLKYPSNQDFDKLDKVFRPVVTDMLTGEALVIEEGDLAEAIRSSMSLPAIFEPFQMDGYYFIDGGVRYNLAINVAKKMGYDIIIAIDISKQVRDDPSTFNSNPTVAFLNTITIASATATHAMYKDASIVIQPDMGEFGTLDFMKAEQIYQEGIITSQKYKPELEKVRQMIYPDDYDKNGQRISEYKTTRRNGVYAYKNNLIPTKMVVTGELPEDKKYIQNKFKIIKDKELTPELFTTFVTAISSTGNYTSILPEIIKENDETTVYLKLRAKEMKGAKILLDFELDQTVATKTSTHFNINAEFQARGLSGNGSLLSIRGTALSDFGGKIFYFQPFSPYLFLSTSSSFLATNYQVLSNLKYNMPDNNSFKEFTNTVTIGGRTKNGNLVKISAFYNMDKTKVELFADNPYLQTIFEEQITDTLRKKGYKKDPVTGDILDKKGNVVDYNTLYEKIMDSYFSETWVYLLGGKINYNFDHTDHSSFAHKGFYFDGTSSLLLPIEDYKIPDAIFTQEIDLLYAIPLSNTFSINLRAYGFADFTNKLQNYYRSLPSLDLGMYDRDFLPQIGYYNFFASKQTFGSVTLMYKPEKQLTILGGQLYFMLNGTIAKYGYEWKNFAEDDSDFPMLWQTNLGAGIRIRENYSILLRAGVGNSHYKDINPFLAVDIGSIRI